MLFALLTAQHLPGAALLFTATGAWNLGTFGIGQLAGGSGSDFTTTQTSTANQVLVEVKHSSMTGWNITVRKVDSIWDVNFRLYVQRTGAGTGGGTVTGGTTYQEITNSDLAFLSGSNDLKNIPLQFQLTGLSVVVGAASFNTTVYYTITEY